MSEPTAKKRKTADSPSLKSLVDILLPNDEGNLAWETRPDLLESSKDRGKLLHSLFSTDRFKKLLKKHDKSGPLQFGKDLNAVRFVNGKRDTPNAEVADSKTVWGLYQDGCTLQVHQPQRWEEPLANLCALMEQRLGCLVGINAYLTPPHTQGLAPHHDDVEIFVCQTEGIKRWRLYKPRNGFSLPNQPSGDLKEEDLSEPIMDITLKAGDILYMPRGTIHQAVAQEAASTHLTISTYQGFSYGVLAQAVLQTALEGQEEPVCLPHTLKQGLPWGFLYQYGMQADLLQQVQASNTSKQVSNGLANKDSGKPDVGKALAAGLRMLADQVEGEPELLSRAADLMSMDFMNSRAPPTEASLLPLGKEPIMDDAVQCRGHNAFRLVNMDPAQAPDMQEGLVKVVSSLANPIEEHMMGEDEDEHDSPDACCAHGHDHSHDHHANGKAQHHSNGAHTQTAKHDSGSEADEEREEQDEDDDSGEEDDNGTADLVFPAAYGPALAELLSSYHKAVNVKDIRLPNAELQLDLAVTLWKEGIVCVQQSGSRKPAKSARK